MSASISLELNTAAMSLRTLCMFARGALTDPMIFQRLRDIWAGRAPAPRTAEGLAEAALTHIRLCRELDGTPRGFRAIRAFLPRYAKGFSGIRALRQSLLTCHDWDELEAMAGEIALLEPDPDQPQALGAEIAAEREG